MAGILLLASASGAVQVGPVQQNTLKIVSESRSVLSSEYFDGVDWEVQIWDFQSSYYSKNDIDDRNVDHGGALAVWQRLTDQGWEIEYWTLVDEKPQFLTNNFFDDTKPRTDGQYIAWQQKRNGTWQVMYVDMFSEERVIEQLSNDGPATDVDVKEGLITFQQWINDNWEIMVWHPLFGIQRATYNDTPDLHPTISDGKVFFEGVVKGETDKEILEFDILTGLVSKVTDNEIDHEGLTAKTGKLRWFERRGGVSALVERDKGKPHHKLLKILPALQQDLSKEDANGGGGTENKESQGNSEEHRQDDKNDSEEEGEDQETEDIEMSEDQEMNPETDVNLNEEESVSSVQEAEETDQENNQESEVTTEEPLPQE